MEIIKNKRLMKFVMTFDFLAGIMFPIYYALRHDLFGMLFFDITGIIGYFGLKQYFKGE
jgi:hypothetical protein